MNIILLLLCIVLAILLSIAGIFLLRFARIIFVFEDDLSEAIQAFNSCEESFEKIINKKFLFDSPELKPVIMDAMMDIKACKFVVNNLTKKFTQRSKSKYVEQVIQEEEEE